MAKFSFLIAYGFAGLCPTVVGLGCNRPHAVDPAPERSEVAPSVQWVDPFAICTFEDPRGYFRVDFPGPPIETNSDPTFLRGVGRTFSVERQLRELTYRVRCESLGYDAAVDPRDSLAAIKKKIHESRPSYSTITAEQYFPLRNALRAVEFTAEDRSRELRIWRCKIVLARRWAYVVEAFGKLDRADAAELSRFLNSFAFTDKFFRDPSGGDKVDRSAK